MSEPQPPEREPKSADEPVDDQAAELRARGNLPARGPGFFEPELFEPDRALEDARAQLAGLLGGEESEGPVLEPSILESNHPAFELHRAEARREPRVESSLDAKGEPSAASDTVRPEPLSESGLANADDLDTSFDDLVVDPSDPRFETANDPRIPEDRSFFKIGEAAKITGVKPYVLRYWETEFSWIRPTKTSARQRLYRRQDLALILQIRRLRYKEQQTIASVRDLLKSDRGDRSDRGKKRKKSQAPALRTRAGSFPTGELALALADMRRSVMELLSVVDD